MYPVAVGRSRWMASPRCGRSSNGRMASFIGLHVGREGISDKRRGNKGRSLYLVSVWASVEASVELHGNPYGNHGPRRKFDKIQWICRWRLSDQGRAEMQWGFRLQPKGRRELYVRHYVATKTRFVRGISRQCLLHGWHREIFIYIRVGDNMHLMRLLDTSTERIADVHATQNNGQAAAQVLTRVGPARYDC